MFLIFCGNGQLWITPQPPQNTDAYDLILPVTEAAPEGPLGTALAQGKKVLVTASGKQALKKHFFSRLISLQAAGGLVRNQVGHTLLIFRRGRWDLPKGKIDPGESRRAAALREVKEETGLRRLRIIKRIRLRQPDQPCTAHLYPLNNRWAIKKTWWYLMFSPDQQLVPQIEEDITDLGWFTQTEVQQRMQESYPLIRWVVQQV